jgi:Na+/melibiose symporter-like transporter
MRPRILPSRLEPSKRRIYRGVLVVFGVVFLAMIWPVVTLFSHTEPLIGGLPFFLFYLTVLLLVSFLVLWCLFRWEERTGSSSDPEEEES